jgi:hypothetical protein
MSTAEQRRRLRAWRRKHERATVAWRETYLGRAGVPAPLWPPFPPDLLGMLCGARTRAGPPCKRAAAADPDLSGTRWGAIPRNGRCRLHGGASTGPRTAGGKARSAANGRRPKRGRPSAAPT